MTTDKLHSNDAGVNPRDGEGAAPPARRPYRSQRREEQARQTRMAILDAAQELFVERGYVAATVADVASRAGVAPETIYSAFRNKRSLLKRLADVRAAGDEEPIPVAQREWIREIMEAPDGRRKLRLYAAVARGMIQRGVGDVQLVIRAAATADPQIAELWEELKRQRLVGATNIATHLAEHGLLRDGLDADRARDLVWTYISPEIAGLLAERGWSGADYEQWLADTLIAALLPD
ncbi:MAG TPA: helix-turn-helix domain-containing protein [Euzebyales bacterium]|nr:helix-turn-helix domain-containing protein [Euzebyales bacterium]